MDKPPIRVPIWKREEATQTPSPITAKAARRLKVINWLPPVVLTLLGCWFWASRAFHISHPPVGLYIGVLAFTAGVVTIWPPENSWSKAAWFLVFGGFLVLEVTTLYQQRGEDQATAESNRKAEDKHFGDVLNKNQEDFDATMDGMKNVLTKQDQALLEAMGGTYYPFFLPSYPAVATPNGPVLPVKVFNPVRPQKPLPLVGVTVDLWIQLAPDARNIQEVASSAMHPQHYDIGTILPGVFETPIHLRPGQSYNLIITTRRSLFREMINISSGKIENWCMYQRIDRPKVSEERLVDRGDGKALTEPCN